LHCSAARLLRIPLPHERSQRIKCGASVNVLALQQQREALLRPASQEEILQRLEQRVGPQGRRLLEGFFAKVKKARAAKWSVSPAGPAQKWSQRLLTRRRGAVEEAPSILAAS
jgi:hypothetical protein